MKIFPWYLDYSYLDIGFVCGISGFLQHYICEWLHICNLLDEHWLILGVCYFLLCLVFWLAAKRITINLIRKIWG